MYEYRIQIGICHIGEDNRPLASYFREHGVGMYLLSRQMDIKKLPVYGEHVTVKDWICGFDRLFGYRNTIMYDGV